MKRRKFIEKSLIGTAGLTLGASFPAIQSSRSGANDRIVLGLIGAGDRGLGTIISTCKVNANVAIKTICDVKTTSRSFGQY
jgi:hypothetical protein